MGLREFAGLRQLLCVTVDMFRQGPEKRAVDPLFNNVLMRPGLGVSFGLSPVALRNEPLERFRQTIIHDKGIVE